MTRKAVTNPCHRISRRLRKHKEMKSVQSVKSVPKKENINLKLFKTMNNENKQIWSKILQVLITVLTAIATTFGVTSCMGL